MQGPKYKPNFSPEEPTPAPLYAFASGETEDTPDPFNTHSLHTPPRGSTPKKRPEVGNYYLYSPQRPPQTKGGTPVQIHYCQDGISPCTKDGIDLFDLKAEFSTNGWRRDQKGRFTDPVTLIRNPKTGNLVTLDHRRMVAAKDSGAHVYTHVVESTDRIPRSEYKPGGVKTYGDWIGYRLSGNKHRKKPSPELPDVRGMTLEDRTNLVPSGNFYTTPASPPKPPAGMATDPSLLGKSTSLFAQINQPPTGKKPQTAFNLTREEFPELLSCGGGK